MPRLKVIPAAKKVTKATRDNLAWVECTGQSYPKTRQATISKCYPFMDLSDRPGFKFSLTQEGKVIVRQHPMVMACREAGADGYRVDFDTREHWPEYGFLMSRLSYDGSGERLYRTVKQDGYLSS
jgi:hypothetical protein